ARRLRTDTLKFFALFTSVAGRYGNSGQTDYATANELLNRLACQLHALWNGRVKVSAMNWGPWEGSRHGQGMVTPETRKKFESRGVRLVPAQGGGQAFFDEIVHAPLEDVEVVFGEGPWEQHEVDAGAWRRSAVEVASTVEVRPTTATRDIVWPLLHGMARSERDGAIVLARRIHTDLDAYLREHLLDDVPVLPAAVALELFAESAASLWPAHVVAEVIDLRVMRGLRLEGGGFDAEVVVHGPSAEAPLEVTMELRTAGLAGPPHYRGTVRLADELPAPTPYQSVLHPSASPVSARQAYEERLFHGPCFQTMTRLAGIDGHGALADVQPSHPAVWLPTVEGANAWLFDPGLTDAAAQMGLLWAHTMESESALPSRFGRVRRFGSTPLGATRMHFLVYPERPPHQVRADVAFVDGKGNLRLYLERLECTSSPALNRLGGTWKGEISV
ncbi:MAG: polyketide synthase dehydratase domain-containing protein, partial [Pseudomonadota bacterium]